MGELLDLAQSIAERARPPDTSRTPAPRGSAAEIASTSPSYALT